MSTSDAKKIISKMPVNAVVDTSAKRETSSPMSMTNGTTKLSSLTPARDLTLGGRGGLTGAKKVFVPNLNAVRNKNANVKTSKDTTQMRGRGRGRGADRGGRGSSRGSRGGGASTLIQTAGVFSEGAGAVNIRKTLSSSGYSRDVDDSPSAMRKPTILKMEKKLDLKAELARDKDILKVLDDDIEEEDEQKTDFDRIPVQLQEGKWKYLKTEIKTENNDSQISLNLPCEEESVAIASQIQAMHVAEQQNRQLPRYPQSLQELFLTNPAQSQIFLMQLPDTLPCVDEDTDSPETSKPSDDIKSQTPAEIQKKPIKEHILKKMEEGQVGRLIRYRSGKIKLILGETQFDLDVGMETGFLQDLMSISCNREERSGNMINLGPIQAKITATPDWEHLLKQPLSDDGKL
ncbi:RNA polymerase III subunit C53 isoform X1 [Haematobia irritans]|uniref:RNA polymerase III subunit C53 isoform X1 n=1 Tax=Haematobia irritans TaxID=7368 RepID=UPI003F4F8E03